MELYNQKQNLEHLFRKNGFFRCLNSSEFFISYTIMIRTDLYFTNFTYRKQSQVRFRRKFDLRYKKYGVSATPKNMIFSEQMFMVFVFGAWFRGMWLPGFRQGKKLAEFFFQNGWFWGSNFLLLDPNRNVSVQRRVSFNEKIFQLHHPVGWIQ